ncbi:hypothetical protein E4U21_002946 [Claviceps maximensis]|nr:hypothetical protein E4U21_002946 [Claviceps maximensis]
MKFTTLLSGLAVSAIQAAYAAPLENEGGIEERAAAYCCIGATFKTSQPGQLVMSSVYVERGNGPAGFTVNGCHAIANRNANSCDGWTFTPQAGCGMLDNGDIHVAAASICKFT